MALLASNWLLIESFLIPDGFLKWFYLSFYIHPIFLLFCQIFLWIKTLQRWLSLVLFLPFKLTCYLYSYVLHMLRLFIKIIRSFSSSRTSDSSEAADETVWHDFPQSRNQFRIMGPYSSWSALSIQYDVGVCEIPRTVFYEVESTHFKVSSINFDDMDEEAFEETTSCPSVDISEGTSLDGEGTSSSVCGSSSRSFISSAMDVELNLFSPSPSASSACTSKNSPLKEIDLIGKREEKEEETDPFYKKYSERMRWFDLLNQDRTCGISAFANKQLASHISFEKIEPEDISIPYTGFSVWGKMGKRRILKSLEADFEMVYVAQSCLSWEALHYQYRKVESLIAIACSGNTTSTSTCAFYSCTVADRFQTFQILLERFVEDEMCKGKRFWNYVQKRSSLKSLLQVPQVSGCMEEEKEGRQTEVIRATEVLKAIEKCIKAFWLFVKIDKKKPRWRIRNHLLWARPPIEDPRDLKLLHHLTNTLRKKKLGMKDLKAKKRCRLRRGVNPLGDPSQKKEMLFTMIELKLVSRVLIMSMISTSQLQWCQEKLNHIEFKDGKLMRHCTASLLFPSS